MVSLMQRRREMMRITAAPADKYSWAAVFSAVASGTYSTDYQQGDLIPLDLGTQGNVNMEIVAINSDELATGNGYAHLTFVSKEILATNRALAATNQYSWADCSLRAYLRDTVWGLLPAEVKNNIVEVKKYSRTYGTDGSAVVNDAVSTDTIWTPSAREILGEGETLGVTYTDVFPNAAARVKEKAGTAAQYRLRSFANTNSRSYSVQTSGVSTNQVKSTATNGGVIIGFCI